MSTYPVIFNAEIEDVTIQFDRGFVFTCWVHLKWDGSNQGFGGFVLGGSPFDTTAKCAEHGSQPNFAAEFIGGVMAVAGVVRFGDMKGKIVRVGKNDEYGEVIALGHAVKELWFDPRARFDALGKLA